MTGIITISNVTLRNFLSKNNIEWDTEKLIKELHTIESIKKALIERYIKAFDKLIMRKSIKIKYKIYRCMPKEYEGNEITNYSSWSLLPHPTFCELLNSRDIHLYIAIGGCSGIYIENNSIKSKKYWMPHYEYEVVLRRGIKFVEQRVAKFKIINPGYILDKSDKSTKYTLGIVHYIKFI